MKYQLYTVRLSAMLFYPRTPGSVTRVPQGTHKLLVTSLLLSFLRITYNKTQWNTVRCSNDLRVTIDKFDNCSNIYTDSGNCSHNLRTVLELDGIAPNGVHYHLLGLP